ncbi:MAG: alpha-L-rhamnosidase N-terminal domain-containing protein [Thermoguttaceae bacterium]|nr:alpha-L-rhamnosidase N-terminal domain-containing protein [Thermoguttaceae bacterium]
MRKRSFILLSFVLFACVFASPTRAKCEISRLSVDARVTPTIGVDSRTPEFAWELTTKGAFGVTQKSYSIEVASSREALESGNSDCWKSGEVRSEKTYGVIYEGKPLTSSKRYYWRTTVCWTGTDAKNVPIEKTESACGEFVTGIMDPSEWKAKWITAERTDKDPLPLLYRNFKLDQSADSIADAFLHVCGLGQHIVSVNSTRLGDRLAVDPGWTNYKKTCLYSTFDVKKELSNSDDCSISVLLGNGMYNVPGGRYIKFSGSFGLPKLIAQLVIRYKDGTIQTVVSDKSWQTLPSPVVFSCVYGGDDVDFSLGVVSKNRILSQGVPRKAVKTEGPGGVLRAQIQRPVVAWETMKPISVKTLDNGQIEANFGFNFAGRPSFRCVPRNGSKITINLAEMENAPWKGHSDSYLFNDLAEADAGKGEIAVETARVPLASIDNFDKDAWKLSISPEETFSSVFGYWGFQYAYIDGAEYEQDLQKALTSNSAKTQIVEIEADRIGADLERVGSFESDGAYLNEIDLMIDRSVRSNIVSLFTDCPHREKLGWLEETHLMGPSILYRYNLQTLFRKICRDMTEAQLEDGMIPDIAPEYTRFSQGFFWSAEWSSACVQVPWLLYRWYGDEEIIGAQYETMDKYVRYMASTRDSKGLVKAGLGDWYDWTPERRHAGYSQHTPGELTATAFLCDNARILAIFAEKLGKTEDAAYYRKLHDDAVADFQKAYFNPETNVVATGSQASYAFALCFNLVPVEAREAAFENLLADIEKWEYRPSCGEVAWPFVIRTLSEFGRADVLWKMLQREDAPGYVHMLTKWGMKTLSETWDGPGSSMNHFMFGAIQEWFSSDIVGIRQAEDSIGYKKSVLHPSPMVGKINRAKGDYRSQYGVIVSDWQVDESTGTFTWNVSIPSGATSQLEIPVADEKSSVSIKRVDGETCFDLPAETTYQEVRGDNPSRRVTTIGSGNYRITAQIVR